MDITLHKRSSRSNSGSKPKSDQPKKKRGFLDGYKTYDPLTEGYGNPQSWRKAFNQRMNLDEARQIVGEKSPFEILGLAETETNWETIKKTFRALAMKYHPDVCKDDDATQKMQEIVGAYTILEERFGK